MSERCPGFGDSGDLAHFLRQREQEAPILRPSMFPEAPEGTVVATGVVKFATGGRFGHDTEYLETSDGTEIAHDDLFRGRVGNIVKVVRDASARFGFRLEDEEE